MKKLFCIALALCLVFALAACGEVESETSPTPNYDGVTPSDLLGPTPEPTPTPEPQPVQFLSVNGVNLVSNGQLTNIGFKGFSYADGVLTVTDVTLQSSDSSKPIIAWDGGDLEIVISGTVTLESSGGIPAISGGSNALTLSGDGTLTVNAADAAAFDVTGALTVGCVLNATGAPACSGSTVTAAEGHSVTANDGTTLSVA